MPKNPTNKELAEGISEVKDEVKEMKADIKELRDFMSFSKGAQSRKSDGSVDYFGIAKQFLVFLTAAVGAIALLLQIMLKVLDK